MFTLTNIWAANDSSKFRIFRVIRFKRLPYKFVSGNAQILLGTWGWVQPVAFIEQYRVLMSKWNRAFMNILCCQQLAQIEQVAIIWGET